MRYVLAFILGIFVQTLPSMAHKHKNDNHNPLDPREQETKDPLQEGNTEGEEKSNLQLFGK